MNDSSAASKSKNLLPPKAYGKEIILAEAEALTHLANSLDESFDRAVDLILNLPNTGRVIVSGIGKAGFIGMKISATFASISIPSFFLHPTEASHGDLGRYTPNDIAVVLSNSGETNEILRILSHVKHLGCKIITITGASDSRLASQSDVVISIGKLDEAGPLGLAPTTSTTAMLALGDALAMAIVKERGFSAEKFAFLHPGGNLGRSLKLVSDIMRKGDENCIVSASAKAREVLHAITVAKGRPGAASVVDSNGILVGVFTDGDFRRCLDSGDAFLELPIEKVMGKTPKIVSCNAIVSDVLAIIRTNRIDQVIVVDEQNHPVGLVDIQDLIRL